jgi:hypothetical protein
MYHVLEGYADQSINHALLVQAGLVRVLLFNLVPYYPNSCAKPDFLLYAVSLSSVYLISCWLDPMISCRI